MEWKKITVAYIVVCVSKCLAMSHSELEDFVEFIQKTSHLDEPLILKKGTRPGDEFDEDDPVSDHAWEESGKFEGDLILNERQRRLIIQDVTEGLARNGLTDTTKRWPNNEVIYYIQKEHFSSDQVQAIQDGIDDLARASCVKFRPYRKGDRDAVVVQGSRRGCFSQVGYQGGYQVLNLSGRHPVGRGCFRHGTVVHEFLHTLGFFHMQSSPDRDDYIDVLWQNIVQPARHNFRKYNSFSVSDFGVGYDYDSVLHYSRKAFSSNGGDTLVPKQNGASIGQRIGLSDKDVKKLNKMYCDADSDSHDESSVDLKPPKGTSSKKSKNKPFTGHGIGYHQGKTVVIKLPAADTYKLSDLPKFHIFDYFSKTPQTMSSATLTEGLGAGKEINYNFDPTAIEQYKQFYNTEGFKAIAQNDKPGNHEKVKNIDNQSRENEKNHKKTDSGQNDSSSSEDYDIDEAFERLGHVILSQVYPSQQHHYDHRQSSDYSKFNRPIKEKTAEPEIQKVDDAFRAKPLNNIPKGNNNEYLSKLFIKDLSESGRQKIIQNQKKENTPAPFSVTDKKYSSKETDSSYGTAFPFKVMQVIKDEKFVTPDSVKFENLHHKHNYSGLYKPVVEDNSDSPFVRALAPSRYVMEGAEHHENNKDDNKRYNVHEYTYHPSEDRAFSLRPERQSLKLQLKSDLRNIHRPSEGKPIYKLFGVIVPITQNWYKIDYDTHLGDYSRDTSGSSEDHG